MTKGPEEDSRRGGYDFSRTVNYYALLIAVIGCVNLWIYWSRGSTLTLVLAVFCFVCVVAWLVVARRMVR
jgi:hypothetical protein